MTFPLDSLPLELLERVISFVEPRSSLFHLTLVSSKFKSLTIPHLYQNVFLESESEWGARHLLPFTFLILQNPYIASLVKTFTFRGGFLDEYPSSLDPDDEEARLPWPDHPDRDDILRRVVGEISRSKQEEAEWLQEVLPSDGRRDDAIFALLLISFPNLRRLDFEIGDSELGFLERVFNRIAYCEPPFDSKPVFTQLTDIMLASMDDKYPMPYVLFAACSNFPAVKRLYGHRLGAEEDRPQLELSNLRPATSLIETLELRDSKLHLGDLAVIIGALKSPHTLIYHIGNSWARTSVRTPEILSSLEIHATSICRLALDHDYYYPFQQGLDTDDHPYPLSFTSFAALTQLRVAPVFLFGDADLQRAPEPGSPADIKMKNRLCEALPYQLESLYVTNAAFIFGDKHAHIATAFETLLQRKECVPQLRELVFEGPFEGEEMIQRVGRVLRVAEEKGLNARAMDLREYGYDYERGWGWDEEVDFERCAHNGIGKRVQVLPEPREH